MYENNKIPCGSINDTNIICILLKLSFLEVRKLKKYKPKAQR